MSKRTIGLLLIAVVALGAMTGVAAAEGDLGVTVDDADGEPTVTVTENDTAVENATVNVSVVDPANESYAGAGEYETDANGTVALPAAAEDVTVNVTATAGNVSASTTVDLEAPDGLELGAENTDGEPLVTVTDDDTAVENATVNVTTAAGQNASYVGEGEYATDANGTVTLPAAEENVTVDVTAEYENASVSTTVDLIAGGEDADEDQPFGRLVQDFIDRLQDREGGIGAAVSDFVTENNPGNAPDHAGSPGGPDDTGNGGDAGNASDGPGNAPDHAGNGNGSEQGPPDHAGPNGDGGDANESDDRGPPDHAGPGGDSGDDAEDAEDDADDAEDAEDAEDDDGTAGNGPGNGQGNGPGN